MDGDDDDRPEVAGLREAGYELVCRLGEGGMAEVWAAAKIGIEGAVKPCAIKVIRPDHAEDTRYRGLFVTEGRLAMMLGHANIVSVFDVGVVGRMLFMAMEWVDGVDLGTFRRRIQLAAGGQPLAIPETAHIAGALLDALGYAHGFCVAGCEQGVIHRDISPRNVMITSRGEVKLMDFGLAGLDPGQGERTGPRFRGTLRYLSREQARGRPEAASDLFAVGAILHELLDGRKFRYQHDEEQALVASIFEEGIPRLDRPVPSVIESLRRGLLEPRAELRFRTARRALTTLASWPGYRNRRLQLETLYRQVIGEPRSGLTQLLSLGVQSELLDDLRRRVERARADMARPRRSENTVPWVAGRSASARGVTPASDDGSDAAVVRPRPAAKVRAHRVASLLGAPDDGHDGVDELEQEITEPWPSRDDDGHDGVDELEQSATAWLSSSDPRASDEPEIARGREAVVEDEVKVLDRAPDEPRGPGRVGWLAVMVPAGPFVDGLPSLLTGRLGSGPLRLRRALWPLLWVLVGGLCMLAIVGLAQGEPASAAGPVQEAPR